MAFDGKKAREARMIIGCWTDCKVMHGTAKEEQGQHNRQALPPHFSSLQQARFFSSQAVGPEVLRDL